jgi:hypothetical protein
MTLVQIMFWAILGHFIGDYLLQSKKTALGKSERTWKGVGICAWHSWIYTVAVCSMVTFCAFDMRTVSPGLVWAYPMIFLTHYPIDRWSLADKWLELIKGRRLSDWQFRPGGEPHGTDLPLNLVHGSYMATQQAFAAIVYTVVDNLMHIILMTVGFAALLHWGVI